MPADKLPASLRAEVSKLARLTHVQNGLPPAMRGLPLVAIAVGEAISRATKSSSNLIEERILGKSEDEVFLLGYPRGVDIMAAAKSTQSKPERGQGGREGVMMMCAKCGKQKPDLTKDASFEELTWLRKVDGSALGAMDYSVMFPGSRPVGVKASPRD